jgi:hypothetical protein
MISGRLGEYKMINTLFICSKVPLKLNDDVVPGINPECLPALTANTHDGARHYRRLAPIGYKATGRGPALGHVPLQVPSYK